MAAISLLFAYLGAAYIYNLDPPVFVAIAGIIPPPVILSPFGIALAVMAAFIWFVVNSFLYIFRLRKI